MVKALLIGSALGGVALLLYKHVRDAQKAAEKAPSSKGDPCAEVGTAVGAVNPVYGAGAYLACKAAVAIGTDWAKQDGENRQLNGEVAVPMSLALVQHVYSAATGLSQGIHGSVVRFANGCEPFEGAPGWSKCAAGTHSMRGKTGQLTHKGGDGKREKVKADFARVGTATDGDPFTQGPYVIAGKRAVMPNVRVPDKFDLPLAPGETGWIANGRLMKCPAGTQPAWNLRDHRTPDALPPCTPGGQASWGSGTAPPAVTGSGSSRSGGTIGGVLVTSTPRPK